MGTNSGPHQEFLVPHPNPAPGRISGFLFLFSIPNWTEAQGLEMIPTFPAGEFEPKVNKRSKKVKKKVNSLGFFLGSKAALL